MNEKLLAKSINSLSVVTNRSSGISHANDESRAKELFKALVAHHITYTHDEIYRLATENGWMPHHAEQIANLAEKIANGVRVKIPNPMGWGEMIITKIKAELSHAS